MYIANTIGEMGLWYGICPLVFIGGSLIPHGGQNFMEPSRCRDAVVVGPHMHNFTDAMNRAKKSRCGHSGKRRIGTDGNRQTIAQP